MDEPIRPEGAAAAAPSLTRTLVDPVVAILLVAGLFDGITDNWIHAGLLWAVAAGLIVEARRGEALDEPVGALTWPGPIRERRTAARRRLGLGVLTVSVVYVWIAGAFGRYTWPMTAAIVIPAAAVVALGWPRRGAEPAPIRPVGRGSLAWAAVFLAACLMELMSLLLQPSFRTDSYTHPTISFLMDPVLASHAGRAAGLLVWMLLGWYLLTSLARPPVPPPPGPPEEQHERA